MPVVSIWMDYMEGGSLSSIIAEFGALPQKVPTHTLLKAQGASRTCNESKEEEEGCPHQSTQAHTIHPFKRVCMAMITCRPAQRVCPLSGSTCPPCHTHPFKRVLFCSPG